MTKEKEDDVIRLQKMVVIEDITTTIEMSGKDLYQLLKRVKEIKGGILVINSVTMIRQVMMMCRVKRGNTTRTELHNIRNKVMAILLENSIVVIREVMIVLVVSIEERTTNRITGNSSIIGIPKMMINLAIGITILSKFRIHRLIRKRRMT